MFKGTLSYIVTSHLREKGGSSIFSPVRTDLAYHRVSLHYGLWAQHSYPIERRLLVS